MFPCLSIEFFFVFAHRRFVRIGPKWPSIDSESPTTMDVHGTLHNRFFNPCSLPVQICRSLSGPSVPQGRLKSTVLAFRYIVCFTRCKIKYISYCMKNKTKSVKFIYLITTKKPEKNLYVCKFILPQCS